MGGPHRTGKLLAPLPAEPMESILHRARTLLVETHRRYVRVRERMDKAELYTGVHDNVDPDLHLREAVNWLCRAQDDGSDRGVSYGCVFGEALVESYPETTGYIICTFLHLADHFKEPGFLDRAIEMGRWEVSMQMPCGAAGMLSGTDKPAIFDTGMVLLGWAALYRRTRDPEIRRAAERAGKWMLGLQNENGHWELGNDHGLAHGEATIYNVKAAWGLAEAGVAMGFPEFVQAAIRNAEHAMSKQLPNGCYEDCCLMDPNRPLIHTIVYAMQGLLGIGQLVGRRDFIDAAQRTADSLIELMDERGFIPGRITHDFRPAVDWCCYSGTAQASAVWSNLAEITGDPRYDLAAERANRYLMERHDVTSLDPNIRGGAPGSWPVWGDYRPYMVLNWATKFFVDALLLRMK